MADRDGDQTVRSANLNCVGCGYYVSYHQASRNVLKQTVAVWNVCAASTKGEMKQLVMTSPITQVIGYPYKWLWWTGHHLAMVKWTLLPCLI